MGGRRALLHFQNFAFDLIARAYPHIGSLRLNGPRAAIAVSWPMLGKLTIRKRRSGQKAGAQRAFGRF
jgi:hypothetical protein